jgi:hypothetical protein
LQAWVGTLQKKTQHRPNVAHKTFVVFELMRKAPLSVAMNEEAQQIVPIGLQDLGKTRKQLLHDTAGM